MFTRILAVAALALAIGCGTASGQARTGTAPVNGLQMYYEVHGAGEPLVLLHGAYLSIRSNWSEMIPTLAKTHQVIAVELQAHGRTSDADRPITYEGMADDVAALLDHLGIGRAAVFGYSMGGGVALQVAVRHPNKVSRLVVASAAINYDGYPADFYAMIQTITPELMAGSPFQTEYLELAPQKDGFPTLVAKLKALDLDRFAWPEKDIAAISVPTLLIFGDADIVTMGHIAKMHRLLGGVANGDTVGLPKVQLAVLPGTTHINVFFDRKNVETMKQLVPAFLATKLPAPPPAPQIP
jgi:pimeloyl-ACP methyl ester carboxylesterase